MSNLEIDSKGNKRWRNSKGELHRLDDPACEYADGSKGWYVNDKCHRLDGPAFEGIYGLKEWWINDIKVNEDDYPEAVLLYKCKQVLES